MTKTFTSPTVYITKGGVPKARAYCDKRSVDCAALRKEIDTAFGGAGPQHGYTALMYSAIGIRYNRGTLYPWTLIEKKDALTTVVTPVRTEAQVLAYILARWW